MQIDNFGNVQTQVTIKEEDMTPEQRLFQRLVEACLAAEGRTDPWKDGYTSGLQDAFILITGEDIETVIENLHEAVNEARQRAHDEMLAADELYQ